MRPFRLLCSIVCWRFLEAVHYPLAVRSSSLLEDSQYQPFSGVYETFMLANQHPDIEVRLEQLLEAIKLVYASTFSQHAKAYVRATPYRLEEEKMAVLLQQVVGAGTPSASILIFPASCGPVTSIRLSRSPSPTDSPPSHWGWDGPWSMEASR